MLHTLIVCDGCGTEVPVAVAHESGRWTSRSAPFSELHLAQLRRGYFMNPGELHACSEECRRRVDEQVGAAWSPLVVMGPLPGAAPGCDAAPATVHPFKPPRGDGGGNNAS